MDSIARSAGANGNGNLYKDEEDEGLLMSERTFDNDEENSLGLDNMEDSDDDQHANSRRGH